MTTQQSSIGATRFRTIPANGTYTGLTALRLDCGRELVTMNTGPEVEAALLAGEAEMARLLEQIDLVTTPPDTQEERQ